MFYILIPTLAFGAGWYCSQWSDDLVRMWKAFWYWLNTVNVPPHG